MAYRARPVPEPCRCWGPCCSSRMTGPGYSTQARRIARDYCRGRQLPRDALSNRTTYNRPGDESDVRDAREETQRLTALLPRKRSAQDCHCERHHNSAAPAPGRRARQESAFCDPTPRGLPAQIPRCRRARSEAAFRSTNTALNPVTVPVARPSRVRCCESHPARLVEYRLQPGRGGESIEGEVGPDDREMECWPLIDSFAAGDLGGQLKDLGMIEAILVAQQRCPRDRERVSAAIQAALRATAR